MQLPALPDLQGLPTWDSQPMRVLMASRPSSINAFLDSKGQAFRCLQNNGQHQGGKWTKQMRSDF